MRTQRSADWLMSLTLSVPAWSLISSLNRSACIVTTDNGLLSSWATLANNDPMAASFSL